MQILVINCGSSSLKYAVFEHDSAVVLARGLVERVGSQQAVLRRNGQEQTIAAPDHAAALLAVAGIEDFASVAAVGHRVVHGGEFFTAPTPITAAVMQVLAENIHLAPLHNPANIAGIEAAQLTLPHCPQVAVFDTGFHASLPAAAFLYAIPRAYYEQDRIRRYGFHGTSHQYVSETAAHLLERPLSELRLITLHLGNGASACAVQFGQSIDTTMGFTPLEGLMMGTRSGDLDPAIVLELARREGVEGANTILNKRSGFLGLAGASDLRDVWAKVEAGDGWAADAIAVYSQRVRKTIGAYAAVLGGLDAVVFTAGVGENDWRMREQILAGLGFLGLELDETANQNARTGVISRKNSPVTALVVPTDEEWAIAKASALVIAA
jgi:acetate kinase